MGKCEKKKRFIISKPIDYNKIFLYIGSNNKWVCNKSRQKSVNLLLLCKVPGKNDFLKDVKNRVSIFGQVGLR